MLIHIETYTRYQRKKYTDFFQNVREAADRLHNVSCIVIDLNSGGQRSMCAMHDNNSLSAKI